MSAASADFLNQLEVADCSCRATALGKRINFSLFHIDQAELAATAGAIDTLEVRVIDQLDTVLAMGTADLHGEGNPGDVTSSFCHEGEGVTGEGGSPGLCPQSHSVVNGRGNQHFPQDQRRLFRPPVRWSLENARGR